MHLQKEGCVCIDDCLSTVSVRLWFAHGSCPLLLGSVTTACQQIGQLFWLPRDFCYFTRSAGGFYDAYLAQFSSEGLRRAAVPQGAAQGYDSSVVLLPGLLTQRGTLHEFSLHCTIDVSEVRFLLRAARSTSLRCPFPMLALSWAHSGNCLLTDFFLELCSGVYPPRFGWINCCSSM